MGEKGKINHYLVNQLMNKKKKKIIKEMMNMKVIKNLKIF